nr:Qat anti-phage system QueC-like protein QatC [Ensifer aridi]
MKKVNGVPSGSGLELLLLAALVSVADTRINRVRSSQDGWTREIGVYLPVADPHRWQLAKPILERMLRFLTGDLWVIDFRPWVGVLGRPPQQGSLIRPTFDAISLFSGGLDSLIGAIDRLEQGKERIYFVSHKADGSISKPQRDVFEVVTRNFHNSAPARLAFPTGRVRDIFTDIGGENSTRGRSFLFIALGAFAGSALDKPFPIYVPENGLISLNVPLDPTRLASNSTRTTHPYYFHRWNELLAALGISGTVQNPYWNKTKGEMIVGCKRPDVLKATAHLSISCAKPAHGRWEGSSEQHCGYCLPCIIRRAAFLKGAKVMPDPSGYRMDDPTSEDLDSTNKRGEQFRGFEYAIERLRQDPSRSRFFIYKTGPLFEDQDRIKDLEGVYTRGMEEVAAFLKGITTVSSRATS